MKKLTAIFIVFLAFGMVMAYGQNEQKKGEPWDIPEKYKKMENPVSMDDKEMQMVGRSLYGRFCKSCHGRKGEGDGPKARRLETFPGDFTKCDFKENNNDGEMYYMSIIGRDEMPNYEKKIPNEKDRWAVINYIKSLSECDE